MNRLTRPDSLLLPTRVYVGAYHNELAGTIRVERGPFGRVRAGVGVLTSLLEPVDSLQLRAELVPGNGQSLLFYSQGAPADRLFYDGLIFRRR